MFTSFTQRVEYFFTRFVKALELEKRRIYLKACYKTEEKLICEREKKNVQHFFHYLSLFSKSILKIILTNFSTPFSNFTAKNGSCHSSI